MKLTKQLFIPLAPALAVIFYFFLQAISLENKVSIAAAITLLTVIWWVTEAIPIPATSLVPFALLPMFNVVDHKTVASALGSHVILLLMGAFMLSKAIEKSGAHERLAVYMVKLVGVTSGRRMVLGFMLASAFLSMWISNTATTLIMLPIALAILKHIDNQNLKVALILGIAYAASVGGVGTPIGTPPNVIFMGIYEEQTGVEFGFLEWMKIGVPVVVLAIPLIAFWLTRKVKLEHEVHLPTLGPWRKEEKRTLWVFGLTALAWITRKEPFGGWSGALDINIAGDSTVALLAVVIMFIVPNGKGSRLLDWDSAKTIPWGMLLLFAGGIAIAKAFMASGLIDKMGVMLTGLSALPVFALILSTCLFVTFLTEFTSNSATATLLMPILATAGGAAGIDPQLLMMPAAISASCAFMMPVATAPNAIVYGTNKFHIKDMAREGLVLNIMLAFVISGVCFFTLK